MQEAKKRDGFRKFTWYRTLTHSIPFGLTCHIEDRFIIAILSPDYLPIRPMAFFAFIVHVTMSPRSMAADGKTDFGAKSTVLVTSERTLRGMRGGWPSCLKLTAFGGSRLHG
jgi:hypothetical protein